jgi:O-antigen/teichoic acid export membrane protein
MSLVVRMSSMSFVLLYIIAAIIHSFFTPTQNFFCDLFYQGKITHFLAILALFAISVTIASFFIWFANQTLWSKRKKLLIKICGIVSAGLTTGIFSRYHDELILIASIVGILPVFFISLEIIKKRKKYIPVLGLFAFGFLSFYNIIFYFNLFETEWPIIQKFSISLCLIWINILVIKKQKRNNLF